MSALLTAFALGVFSGSPPGGDVPSIGQSISSVTNYPLDGWFTNGYQVLRLVQVVGSNVSALSWSTEQPTSIEVLYGNASVQDRQVLFLSSGPAIVRRQLQVDGTIESQIVQFDALTPGFYTNNEYRLDHFRRGTIAEYIWTNLLSVVGANSNDINQRRVFTSLPLCYSNVPPYTNGWFIKLVTNWTFWALGKSNPLWTTTCGQTWYQGSAKLVTKRHWVTTGHMYPAVGEKHYWVGAQGQTAERTTIAVTNGYASGYDLAVCLLDSDVPDWVHPAWLADFDWVSDVGKGMPTIKWGQGKWVGVGPVPSAAAAFQNYYLQPGDSGSPIGIFLDGRFVMFGYGIFIPSIINQWITNLNTANGVPQLYAVQTITSNEIAARFVQ